MNFSEVERELTSAGPPRNRQAQPSVHIRGARTREDGSWIVLSLGQTLRLQLQAANHFIKQRYAG